MKMSKEKDENKNSGQAASSSKDQQRSSDNEREEQGSKSESLASASASSSRSRVETVGLKLDVEKPPVMKQSKTRDEKRRYRKGKVEKRRQRRRRTRKHSPTRRAPKRALRMPRQISECSVISRLSSRSGARTPVCKFCGHRCCLRRFVYEVRRGIRRNVRKVKRVVRRKTRNVPKPLKGSKAIQVGSRSIMLSPLFITSNAAPASEPPEKTDNSCEVTPEMIHEALRRLTMWRQHVQTDDILEYIKRTYPVNPVDEELNLELTDKLRIAAIVGIVTQVDEGRWCLNCALERRALDKSHVTNFWQVYADTMKPINRETS